MVSRLRLGRPEAKTDVQNVRRRDGGALYLQLFFAEVRDRVLESGRGRVRPRIRAARRPGPAG
jgi:hypothetical protein